MRVGYRKFKEIRKMYGSSDFEIGSYGNDITIRFGYWGKADLKSLQSILGCDIKEVEWEDDDCGWQYLYILK